ncbi:ACT domain-containing protein [Clostridium sp.]|mgnify:FL=1|uniref:ACT domain-containing protein n=1 Tax=Clostridium sp. TaxID=1506 RepID=UPI002A919596|nr:ACT domain-containing protein [Clostridium sp.]MDY6011606.1 ACT domain-containing protein [Clostridium sp.]
MSEEKFYVVSENVLPDVFYKVIEVKELLHTGKVKDISEGVKKVGISRSTYYKYKDSIYPMVEGLNSKKLTIILLLSHKSGVLSKVLDFIASKNLNILTINQDIQINMTANVSITLDVSKIKSDIKNFLYKIKEIDGVVKIRILAIE